MWVKSFNSNEAGAVTVDWVVLTAAIVGIAIAVLTLVAGGINTSANSSNTQIASSESVAGLITGASANTGSGFVDKSTYGTHAQTTLAVWGFPDAPTEPTEYEVYYGTNSQGVQTGTYVPVNGGDVLQTDYTTTTVVGTADSNGNVTAVPN